MRTLTLLATAGALSLAASTVRAQDWPTRTIRMIVPFPPGGATDIFGRLAAETLSKSLGVPVIVDNRPGAGGNIGVSMAAKAAADGGTISMFTVAQTIAPTVFPKLDYDPVRDLAPITQIAKLPSILLVHPSLPVRNVKELIALAQRKPGALNFASTGIGSSPHMLMEKFLAMTGIKAVHIPYTGAGPALIDQLAGRVEMGFTTGIGPSLEAARTGRLRAIAVSTAERYPQLPDVPTVAEQGVKGFDGSSWQGLVAPAGTPRELIARLNRDLAGWIRSPEGREQISRQGGIPVGNTPEEFAAFIKSEVAAWALVNKTARVTLE